MIERFIAPLYAAIIIVMVFVISSCAKMNPPKTYVIGSREKISSVCIEINQEEGIDTSFVSALQIALGKQGVASSLYGKGMSPASCHYRLMYHVTTDYSSRSGGSGWYWKEFYVEIFADDQVISNAYYRATTPQSDSSSNGQLQLLLKRVVQGPNEL